MLSFLAWYITVTLLGWLTFPLVYRLFPALADRGYSLARAAGLLLWGYIFWLLASLGVAQNNVGGVLLGLAILVGLSLFSGRHSLSPIVQWLRDNLRLVLTVEGLFLFAFAFLAVVRAANPDAVGTEKPMELAFINAILRSPTFPPHDPWLSGYAISYYYFGYVMAAVLAKLTATSGGVTFNLMLSLVFSMSAVGAYGVIYNLLNTADRGRRTTDAPRSAASGLPLVGPLFLLLVSNLEGFLEMLHQRGIFWSSGANFWTWLDIKDLKQPPAEPFGWVPERFWWWWRASRVVQDYDLAGNFREVIDEFPFFSYLLGDLHPHVLAMPFGLLAVAVALNLFLGGWRGETNIFGLRLSVSRTGFFSVAVVLGGLAFLNTWDILVAAALIAAAYVLFRVGESGWAWSRLEDFILFGLTTGVIAILLYLPFYFGFSSQAGGILPNLVNPTRGAHLWVMFGPLLLPILAYLLYLWRGEKARANWRAGFGLALGAALFLWIFSWLLGWLVSIVKPDLAGVLLASQGGGSVRTFFAQASARRLDYFGGLLTLVVVLGWALTFLTADRSPQPEGDETPSAVHRSSSFVLLLIVLGGLLVLAPEFVYLRDQFGSRMNTIFKFYYQAWMLWSLAAAFGAAWMLEKLRGTWAWTYRGGLALVLAMALAYPALGLPGKTNNFKPPFGWTLDSAAHVARENPDEAAAIAWLQGVPDGVVAEAVGGSYTGYARISTHTGLPTVLGWPGHESQWRGGGAEMGSREGDIATLYSTPDWTTAQTILTQYDVRYVIVGTLERSTYKVNEAKFQQFLPVVFRQGDVVIYAVPQSWTNIDG
ncbi:MAG: hypothetical protein GXP40_01325 [Chloroflexi bacterium]|nr:hypothetical protein [Chloroflexota bacterium]